ncbi:MAG: MFS transporter, partial [Microbacterium sp.]
INVGDDVGWVHGWQLMFFVEGLFAVIAGIAAFIFLVDSPEKAKFLTDDEKAALAAETAREDALKSGESPTGIWRSLGSPRVWYFTAIYFCLQVAVYGVTFYLPQQVAALTGQQVGLQVGLLVAVPWFIGAFGLYFFGRYANTTLRRRRLGVLFYLLTAFCIVGSAWAGATEQPLLGMVFITLAVLSFMSVSPITWSYPTAFLISGTAAATGIALINSIGNLGGFLAPILRTNVSEAAGGDPASGIYAIAVFPLIAAVLLFGTKFLKQKADDMLVADEA